MALPTNTNNSKVYLAPLGFHDALPNLVPMQSGVSANNGEVLFVQLSSVWHVCWLRPGRTPTGLSSPSLNTPSASGSTRTTYVDVSFTNPETSSNYLVYYYIDAKPHAQISGTVTDSNGNRLYDWNPAAAQNPIHVPITLSSGDDWDIRIGIQLVHQVTFNGITSSQDGVANIAWSSWQEVNYDTIPVPSRLILSWSGNASVAPGEQLTITAQVVDEFSNPVQGAVVNWSSSNTGVATVSPSSGTTNASGATSTVMTVGSTGSVTITAATGGASNTASFTSSSGITVDHVTVFPTTISLSNGGFAVNVSATAYDASNNDISSSCTFQWFPGVSGVTTDNSFGQAVNASANGASSGNYANGLEVVASTSSSSASVWAEVDVS